MIKISDYISEFLSKIGITDIFLISGGGMMHLLDSVKKNENLNLYFNLNEQATSICADGYAQVTNSISAFIVTTGPGGTNAITGLAASWLDSTPVLAISGQVKTSDMGTLRGLRQFGAQEVDIISIVKPITKYAVTVLKKEDIRYHLEKAVYLATHGRRGPVWIDVPLDIQGSTVDETQLIGFDPSAEGLAEFYPINSAEISKIYQLINISKRPLILAGHGVVASNSSDDLRNIVNEFNIPVMTTWRAKGIFGEDEPLYMGHPGIPTTRYSNYILQNCDLLIIIGTRLNAALTAYAEKRFANGAKKVIIDIEQNEIDKLDMNFEVKLTTDAGSFIRTFYEQKSLYNPINRGKWLEYCNFIKAKYPLSKEVQPFDNEGLTDGFEFADKLSNYTTNKDLFVGSSSGRTCGISHMAFKTKLGQKFISSMGLGSMGFTLPYAIACSIAYNKKRTIAIEGDGSLQHNIQELALVNTYNIPLKLFILSNNGYASIFTMQRNNFSSRFAGCNPESGLGFPSVKAIAQAYNIPYYRIENNSQINSVLTEVMSDDKPIICEIISSIQFDEIPKSMTIANPDGTFTSSNLENLYPFVSQQEQNENMPIWED